MGTKLLQTKLTAFGFPTKVDGIVGYHTRLQISRLQTAFGLDVTGVVDEQTQKVLEGQGQVTKNFNIKEFKCPHCSKAYVVYELVRKLQILRDKIGLPIRVTSGYRCKIYNQQVGGVKNSQHILGKAADVVCSNTVKLRQLAGELFNGIGYYNSFTHLDIRDKKAFWRGKD